MRKTGQRRLTTKDEEWIARRLASYIAGYDLSNDIPGVEIIEVYKPGAAPGAYDPILCCPTTDPEGIITINTAFSPPRQKRAMRHEIGHHLLWPAEPNILFGRRFPLDPDTEARLLRERIVQRAERICFGGK